MMFDRFIYTFRFYLCSFTPLSTLSASYIIDLLKLTSQDQLAHQRVAVRAVAP